MMRNNAQKEVKSMDDKSTLLTISAMAAKLKVNRSSVYRFIEANNISPVLQTGKTRFYDVQTLDKLKKHFEMSVKTGSEKKMNEAHPSGSNELITSLKDQIAQLKQSNEIFNEQLKVKDAQIAALQSNLSKNQELLDHNQQLLLASQNEKKELQYQHDDKTSKKGEFKEVNEAEKKEKSSNKKRWWHFW